MSPERRAMVCRKTSDNPESNWYRIEWAEHDGRTWTEEKREPFLDGHMNVIYFCLSCRLEPYTCVEGPLEEMQDLAAAILAGGEDEHKRCAVRMNADGSASFWSPRNSNDVEAIVHGEDARDLARSILGIGVTTCSP